MAEFEKIVVITKRTELEELTERFNTRSQARFYIQNSSAQQALAATRSATGRGGRGGRQSIAADPFDFYQQSHDAYTRSLALLKSAIPQDARVQYIERSFLPNFVFGPNDLVITLGQDGLVVNTAKYLNGQPLLAFNPDPARIDGVLLPFTAEQAGDTVPAALGGNLSLKNVAMAMVTLNNGQRLYALNDLFIGPRTHQSARYELRLNGRSEVQSSSGIIVSTGAGSTGWFRSVLTGATGVVESFRPESEVHDLRDQYRFDWESSYLCFSVREPFVSKTAAADIVFGRIEDGQTLELESRMPRDGVIFSDGIESDYLEFNSGAVASVCLADRRLRLMSEK